MTPRPSAEPGGPTGTATLLAPCSPEDRELSSRRRTPCCNGSALSSKANSTCSGRLASSLVGGSAWILERSKAPSTAATTAARRRIETSDPMLVVAGGVFIGIAGCGRGWLWQQREHEL